MKDHDLIPKVRFDSVRRALIFVVLGVFLFGSGYYFGFKGFIATTSKYPIVHISRINPSEQKELDFSLFWKIWDTMHTKYYDESKVVDAEMVYGAIRGMVAAVGDPYTVFLPPRQNKMVEEDLKGSFEGVGIQIGFKKGQLAVIAPLPGSPAEKAGVLPGDYIVEIKDVLKGIDIGTSNISLEEAVEAIRGRADTSVILTLIRDEVGKPIITEIKRSEIDVPSVSLSYVGEGNKDIAHVKVSKFAAETQVEWDEAVVELVSNPDLKALIVDLRNNPGGYLQGAVDLASDFLSTGDVVVKEEGGSIASQEYKVEKLGRLKQVKLIVLVNEGSASASEIFAGAMRDHNRAKLVGDTTFGKGTIQEPEQVDGGAGLHITVAKWLTPNGIWVHDTGLEPDAVVENLVDTEEDEQLLKAIELIKN